MKIAVIVSLFPSVSETFVLRQILGLLEAGHDVRIFAREKDPHSSVHPEFQSFHLEARTVYIPASHGSKTTLRMKALGLLVKSVLRSPLQTLRVLSVLLTHRKEFSYRLLFHALTVLPWAPDVLHCHFGQNAILWATLKRMGLKYPLVTTFHGHDVSSYPRAHGGDIYQDLFRVGDRFTYNSESTRHRLLQLGAPPEKLVKLPMGVAIDHIPFSERNLPADQTVRILSVGRLVAMKGRSYAIAAVAEVLASYPNLEYCIVGDGPLRSRLQEQINQTGQSDRIRLLGPISDEALDRLYRSSHLFLHPSVTADDGNTEGQGLVLVEAQAYGLVVVATRHGAFEETVLDGRSGFLVPEKDSAALRDCLVQVLSRPEDWPQIGRCGRRHAEEHYAIQTLNRRLETLFKRVVLEYKGTR